MSNEPFNAPATTTGVPWGDLKGSLLLFTIDSVEQGIKTAFGDTDAVRATIAVLDGDSQGTEYADALVFPKVLQSQLRPSVGGKVLGRLGQGTARPGQSAPWLLSEASDADKAVGVAYLNKTPAFAAPAPSTAAAPF